MPFAVEVESVRHKGMIFYLIITCKKNARDADLFVAAIKKISSCVAKRKRKSNDAKL